MKPDPGGAAIGRAVQAAPGTAALEDPRLAQCLIEGREQDVGVVGVEFHVDRAGSVVKVEHLRPRLASIGSAEEAALGIGAKGVAHGGDQDRVRVARMHNHAADVPRIAQPDVLPGLAGIGGFVDSVTVGDVAAQAGLAAAHVDGVGVGGRHGDGADGGSGLLVEHRLPIGAAVSGLPHAARCAAEIVRIGVARNSGDRQHAPTAKRTYQAVLQALEQLFVRLGQSG